MEEANRTLPDSSPVPPQSLSQQPKSVGGRLARFTNLSRWKKIGIAALVLLFLLMVIGGYVYFFNPDIRFLSPISLMHEDVQGTIFDQPLDEDSQTFDVLLLGYGGPGHQGGFLTDVMMVVHFDFAQSKIALISIPRDTWAALPNGTVNKINAAFASVDDQENIPTENIDTQAASGGGESAKSVVSNVIGMKIDSFIAVDFVGFQKLVGYGLDGIEVEVGETLEDNWYPLETEKQNPCDKTPEEIAQLTNELSGFELEKQFPCRYERIYFPKGTVIMEGGDALKHVRSRHSSSDFDRSRRQQEVLEGVRKKLLNIGALDDTVAVLVNLTQYVQTDVDEEIVQYLLPALKAVSEAEFQAVNLSVDNVLATSTGPGGQFILVPKAGEGKWDVVHEYIQEQLQL